MICGRSARSGPVPAVGGIVTRRASPRAAADVRRRLSGDGEGGGGPLRLVVRSSSCWSGRSSPRASHSRSAALGASSPRRCSSERWRAWRSAPSCQHLFGHVVSTPAMFAVVAMGGVFGAAAQAPLTAIASVVEMTGNFTLTVPVMLVVGIAAALSKHLSYGSIYTTKLLRRGIDIERPNPTRPAHLTVAEVMQALLARTGAGRSASNGDPARRRGRDDRATVGRSDRCGRRPPATAGAVRRRDARSGAASARPLRTLRAAGALARRGAPARWITRQNVLGAIAQRLGASAREIEQGALAGEYARDHAETRAHTPSSPLDGYQVVEIVIGPHSPALGQRLDEVAWPPHTIAAAVTEDARSSRRAPISNCVSGNASSCWPPSRSAHTTPKH